MVWKYWKSVISLAWANTVTELRLNSAVGFILWIIGTISVLASLFFWGSADASRDELVTRISLALAMLGAVPLFFTWKFIGTMPRMHRAIRDWAKELEEAIIEASEADDAILGIAERYQHGLKVLNEGGSLAQWEIEFDGFIKEFFDASLFVQLCAPSPPERGYTTIQRDNGPVQTIQHPPPNERDRIAAKLHKIASLMPYASNNFRGKTFRSLSSKLYLIRQYGLPEHRLPEKAA